MIRLKGQIGMEHFITEINIKQLRHLSDIKINLNAEKRQHLLLTGKNGSGKTTLLLAMKIYLQAINDGELNRLLHYQQKFLHYQKKLENAEDENAHFEIQKTSAFWKSKVTKYGDGIEITFYNKNDLDAMYKNGQFVIAYFPAERKTRIIKATGVEDVKLNDFYGINTDPGSVLLKYMVHLKTQQAYARNEGDNKNVERIQNWFDRFESALKVLLDDESIKLEYDYKEYDFKIVQTGRQKYGFDQLSDGYSSIINIVSDLILRMDKNWLLKDGLSQYDIEGIVLIDELETHLHIELQKKILPFLVRFFPGIQFIVTTHSPYILNSISNAKIYDLEKCIELEDLSGYSAEDIVEGYFDSDEYSEELKRKLEAYEKLVSKEDITEDERAERASLRCELKEAAKGLSGEAKEAFEEIERRRKINGKV